MCFSSALQAPSSALHGEFFHNMDFPIMIRRFDLMQADILASRPTELKSAVRTVRTGFLAQTETKISDVSDWVKRACAYAREKTKTKSFKIEKHIEAPLVDLCGRLAVRNVRTCPNPIERVISEVSDFAVIATAIRESRSVALDLQTYGPRKSDGLDPWAGGIRLLSLRVDGQEPWILDLRSIGYDLGDSHRTAVVRQVRSAFDLPAIAAAIHDQITLENVARPAELFQSGF
jgi:hypothetical protein